MEEALRDHKRPRVGRDELNLLEFPIALLADRAPKTQDLVLRFKDGSKEWTLEGSPQYGLPTARDLDVYVILMEITREQNFPQQVEFSRHDVIRRLGWDPHGQSYARLQLALDRLAGVTVRTVNAFWDASERAYVKRRLVHLIDSYEINDHRHVDQEQSLFPSWFQWSPELIRNIRAGHIKSLNLDLYFSLNSYVSRALYRYLDAKRYDGKATYRIGLKKLAWEHLGISRTAAYESQIKQKLAPAHTELIEQGFLTAAEYSPMKNGESMVIYSFVQRAIRERHSTEITPSSVLNSNSASPDLVERLMNRGVSRASATELAESQPEECERQLVYLDHRQARDPGAVLVSAIREGWAPPVAWVDRQKQSMEAEIREERQRAQVQKRQRTNERERQFEQLWEGLEPERREALEREAMQLLRVENKILADLSRRIPDSAAVQEALREIHKRLLGWGS